MGLDVGKKIDGKYTAATKGNFVYGGWSKAGQKKFNFYVNKVKEDRASPRAAHMEKEFLSHMQQTPAGRKMYDKLHLRMAVSSADCEDESDCEIYVEPL
jgi:hypothetical protein